MGIRKNGLLRDILIVISLRAEQGGLFERKIRSNRKSIIAKNGSAFFVHKIGINL